MPDLDSPDPINPDDPGVQTMLENLQGNILKGHGRDHTVHVFIRLKGADAPARLGVVARRVVTTAAKQHRETKQFRDFGLPGTMFGNIFLTPAGYRALGFGDEMKAELTDPYFTDGMLARGVDFNDPPPEKWDAGYREGDIHAMILLADDDEAFLLREARKLVNELEEFSTVLVIERGNALRTDSGEGIEHFGYVDGRSQPIYLTTDLFDEKGNSKEGKTDKWNPVEKLKIVLVADGLAGGAADAFGSYFVFRKLEQDVRRFKIREEQLADELGLKDEERERAGAMAVGRFEDGTPLTLSQTDGFIPIKENNFTYADDAAGLKCPFHAHIRKSNPRGDTTRKFGVPEEEERAHRVTRRGITYGERNRHPNAFQALEDLPTEGVGLLFMCFQSSIENQFAFIQSSWVNNVDFLNVNPVTGLDPVIGQGPKSEQHWLLNWGAAGTKDFNFSGFVTLKGGEFFFAPSMPFLRRL
jgi:Dyp-type peroxidase family